MYDGINSIAKIAEVILLQNPRLVIFLLQEYTYIFVFPFLSFK